MLKQTSDKFLKVSFVASYLSVNEQTVRTWIKYGLVEAIQLPSTGTRPNYRIKLSSLYKIVNTKVTVRS